LAIDNFGFEYSKIGKAFVQSRLKARIAATPQQLPPVITSPLNASAAPGVAFSYQITATNNPTSFSSSTLPNGLSCNPLTGKIAGVTSVLGTFNITINATNPYGTGSAVLVLTVAAHGSVTYTIGPNPSTGGATQNSNWLRQDNPYGTLVAEGFNAVDTFNDCGEGLSGSKVNRKRICFDIPANYLTITNVALTFTPSFKTGSFTLGWYGSNTDDYSAGESRAYNYDNLLASAGDGSFTAGVAFTFNWTSGFTPFYNRYGGHFSMILVTSADKGSSGGTTNHIECSANGANLGTVVVSY